MELGCRGGVGFRRGFIYYISYRRFSRECRKYRGYGYCLGVGNGRVFVSKE